MTAAADTTGTRRKLRLPWPSIDASRAGLALGRDDAPLHLDWIIAVMAFLAALALFAALLVNDAASRWRQGLTGTVTVEIPAPPRGGPAGPERLQRVLTVLRADPAVEHAEAVPRARINELLAPWLGKTDLADTLPVPQLVDVTLRSDATFDGDALSRRLAAAVEGTTLDDHGRWVGQMVRIAHLANAITFCVVLLVGVTAVAAVVLTARAALAVHHEAIDILHLMGADDSYIARQFARWSLWLGIRGGALGLGLAIIVLAIVGLASHSIDPALLPRLRPGAEALVLLVVPPATGLLAWATAHRTVMRALKRRM